MQLHLLGVNHKTAPVEVREQLALSPDLLPRALQGLREQAGVREAAILSTCNRAEIYAVGEASAAPRIEQFLAEFTPSSASSRLVRVNGLSKCLYRGRDAESARHLFRVSSGVDSLVLGESQILGQVKTAFESARESGAVSQVLDELFRRAIACGKRARTETNIGRGALSIGSAAVELARQIFGPLSGHTVLLLGAGEMSQLTAQHLVASGANRVLVSNRTYARAQELAHGFDASRCTVEALPWDAFPGRLHEADIVISSTSASEFVLSADQVARAMKSRRGRPLLLVDIAVPRDIEPAAHQIDNVFVYDIDDLQGVVNSNLAQRAGELARVETIIDTEVSAWDAWYRGLQVQPVMSALARHASGVRDREVDAALSQLEHLSPRDREVVKALGRAVAGKLTHAPLRYLREAGAEHPGDAEAILRAFNLDLDADNTTQPTESSAPEVTR